MVSLVLGLVLVAAVTLVFINNSRTRQETEKTNQQIESGRFSTQLLLEELRLAGYFGEFNPSALTTPASLPDPTSTAAADLTAAIAIPVQGYDNGNGVPSGLNSLLTDRRAGTDVLVIRRASTCAAGASGCSARDTGSYNYFQTALCVNQLTTLATADQVLVGRDSSKFITSNSAVTGAAAPPAFLAKRDCVTPADQRSYIVRIYFIAENNSSGDGIPTLKVAELGASSFSVSPLVEGIEQMQIAYGVDSDGDGSPNSYTASPADVSAWRQVTAVKLNILAKNTQPSAGFTDTRTYYLGLDSTGADNIFGPYGDNFKRHVYSTTVRLNNVGGRLE